MTTITVDRNTIDRVLAYINKLEGEREDIEHARDPYGAIYGYQERQDPAVQQLKDAMAGKPATLTEYMANAETVTMSPKIAKALLRDNHPFNVARLVSDHAAQ